MSASKNAHQEQEFANDGTPTNKLQRISSRTEICGVIETIGIETIKCSTCSPVPASPQVPQSWCPQLQSDIAQVSVLLLRV